MKNLATPFSCFAVEAHLNGDNPGLGLQPRHYEIKPFGVGDLSLPD